MEAKVTIPILVNIRMKDKCAVNVINLFIGLLVTMMIFMAKTQYHEPDYERLFYDALIR